jgi:hypothetical protein
VAKQMIYISIFMVAIYSMSALGLFPVVNSYIDTSRLVLQFTILPSIAHIIGDITTNSADMAIHVSSIYCWSLSMLLARLSSQSIMSYLIPLEIVSFGYTLYLFYVLFEQALGNRAIMMMDVKSTLLSKLFLFTSIAICQVSWSKRLLT